MPMPPACPPWSCVWPCRVTPPPSAPTAASSPPTSTGVPGASPVRAAAASRRRRRPPAPRGAEAADRGGCRASAAARLVPALATDVEAVEAVGLGEVAGRLARQPRGQEARRGEEPAGRLEDRRLVRPEPRELGRDVRGVERVGDEIDRVGRRAGPARRAAASASARRSSQVIAGVSARKSSSTGTSVQPMPSTATAATSRAGTPARREHLGNGPAQRVPPPFGVDLRADGVGPIQVVRGGRLGDGAPRESQSAVFMLEVPWSTVTMCTVVGVRSRRGPGRRSYGGVMVPSRSQRSSHRWPAFHRKTWPLISRQLRSMAAIAAMSASVSGSPAAASRLAW